MHEQSRIHTSREEESRPFIISTRNRHAPPDEYDSSKPRLSRQKSEPHSSEITYIYDVLTINYPKDRVIWDLHHYFKVEGMTIDIQFDISYFRDLQIPYTLSSYQAEKHNNRVPSMVVNVLSKSTWKADIGENVDYCKLLEIPLYVVFATFHVATAFYRPPFLRVYILQEDGSYNIQELRELTVDKQGEINTNAIIDTSAIVPFRLGLTKQKKQHEGGLPLYRMILLDKEELKILPTELEKQMEEEKERADKLKQQMEEEKERADKLKQQMEKAEAKIKELEEELEKVKEKND